MAACAGLAPLGGIPAGADLVRAPHTHYDDDDDDDVVVVVFVVVVVVILLWRA